MMKIGHCPYSFQWMRKGQRSGKLSQEDDDGMKGGENGKKPGIGMGKKGWTDWRTDNKIDFYIYPS